MEPYICTPDVAPKINNWLRTRGGIALWSSANLGNPCASWTTPATNADGTPATKPTWQADTHPRIITDAADVLVSIDREVKRFPIALQQGSGLSIECTPGSSRKIRKALDAAGKDAYYVFDVDEAVIMMPEKQVPLTEWMAGINGD
jgi:hypothetical protein